MTLPLLASTIAEVRHAVVMARSEMLPIALAPTMGALHAGHARLIETAKEDCGYVVVSIFVNPTQFGPNEDFARYPRTLEADRELCGRAGADLIFLPDVATMYPPGARTFVEVEGLQDMLCGATRPGHFRGVCSVVLKLFNIVQPDAAYFGQKDAQQAFIVQRMVRDLDVPIDLRIVPTVREADGLALSSRNRYLSPEERRHAPALYRTLQNARWSIEKGERDPARVEEAIRAELAAVPGLRLEYASVVSSETLSRIERLDGPTLIAVAAYLGTTRLIDNVQIDVKR